MRTPFAMSVGQVAPQSDTRSNAVTASDWTRARRVGP